MSTFSDGNSKLTWQSDCAMWLLCLEVVRGRLSLGLGSVALLILKSLGPEGLLFVRAQAIPMTLALSHMSIIKSKCFIWNLGLFEVLFTG